MYVIFICNVIYIFFFSYNNSFSKSYACQLFFVSVVVVQQLPRFSGSCVVLCYSCLSKVMVIFYRSDFVIHSFTSVFIPMFFIRFFFFFYISIIVMTKNSWGENFFYYYYFFFLETFTVFFCSSFSLFIASQLTQLPGLDLLSSLVRLQVQFPFPSRILLRGNEFQQIGLSYFFSM